ncbi:hypothetical protein [Lignipirellula cremea]|uniref:Uncharacterized protein n=1 Tax=Lignipirellula cremea TaxID=2528010 RepID=A0A518DS95_9BACT|nr:hypothetical protein [Lignipirellula cremea]QDU94711.1 hypothetical protein Pla8534_25170 [Lignipirellula cremea]
MNLIRGLVTAMLLASLAPSVNAADPENCEVQCPSCRCWSCKVSQEKVKEKKTCFDCECKAICIPRVRFPWENCCCKPLKCAKVRVVKVLVQHEYECEHCRYKWDPVCVDGCCRSRCGAGCGAGCSTGCAAGCEATCDCSQGPSAYSEAPVYAAPQAYPTPPVPHVAPAAPSDTAAPVAPQPASPTPADGSYFRGLSPDWSLTAPLRLPSIKR